MSVDWAAVRAEFPTLQRHTYLNTATYGVLPRRALEAMNAHWRRREEYACSDFVSWFDGIDQVRASIAELIHGDAEGIAFVPNASSAFAMVIHGMSWSPGDNIVTLAGEYPNYLYAPALLARLGVEVRTPRAADLLDSVDSQTRLVAASLINYATGFRPPIEEWSPFLRTREIPLFLDGTQGVGAIQVDVQALQPAFLAVHGYKWMCSPTGAGFLYVSPRAREWLEPSVIGWRSHAGWRSVENLHEGIPDFPITAERYEGGMLPFSLLEAMGASVRLLLEIGPASIEERVLTLAAQAREILLEKGAESATVGSPIVAARFPDRDVGAVSAALKKQRIHVAARHGHLRVSPHFYNNESDLDLLKNAL